MCFIVGRAGSGKTHHCLERIAEDNRAGARILLVPEQATFQMEKALFCPGRSTAAGAQVLSFRRLAWRTFAETGAPPGLPLDEVGRRMVLRSIIERSRPELRLFSRVASRPGFLESLSGTVREMAMYNIEPVRLQELAGAPGTRTLLARKLSDLSLVFQQYEDFLEDAFTDPDRLLSLAASRIQDCPLWRGARIWVDGFVGFTPQEIEVLLALCRTAAQVTVTLTMEPLCLRSLDGEGLFAPSERTYRLLHEAAERCGIESGDTLILPRGRRMPRFDSPELAHLEREAGTGIPHAYEGAVKDIRYLACGNRLQEVEQLAMEITTLARDSGYRWNDIAVLVHDLESYRDLVEHCFVEQGIPVFIDARRQVTFHPLIELVRALCEIVTANWPGDAVIRLLKTDLLPCSRDEADRLENFALARGIHGRMWEEPEHWGDAAMARLGRKALGPVCRELGRGPRTVLADVVAPVQRVINALDAGGTLEQWARESAERGETEEASIHSQVFQGVMAVLAQAEQYLGDQHVPAAEARQIIEVGLGTLTLGLVPPSLDQVIVGSMDRSRHPRVRAAFILGLHDGGFPAPIREDVVFADREREEMSRYGIEIGPKGLDQVIEQDFLGYLALSRASERLYLLRPLLDDSGKSLAESPLITAIKAIFPGLCEERPGTSGVEQEGVLRRAYSIPAALRELAALSASPEPGAAPLATALQRSLERAGVETGARFLDRARRPNSEANLGQAMVRALTTGRIDLSTSRLECILACPFQHFAQYMLRLEERKTAGLDAPRGGLFMHYALTRFVRDVWLSSKDVTTITDDEVISAMRAACEKALADLAEDSIAEDPVARRELDSVKSALEDVALALVEHSRRGAYRPVAAEMPFGPGSALAMEEIAADSGLVASLTGRIDLVDVAQRGGDSFFRVIDFKSRSQRLAAHDILDGIDLQLAGYAATVLRNPSVLPAGRPRLTAMLYMGLRGTFTRVDSAPSAEDARKQKLSQRRMSGLVSSSPEPVMMMDSFEDRQSLLVPVTLDKDGRPKGSLSVIPEEDLRKLADVFLEHARAGAAMVASGDVRIHPYRRGFGTPCGYCRFDAVCQFDPSRPENRYRYLRAAGQGKRGGGR